MVDRLHAALNGHDPDAVRDVLSEDCVFESTRPPLGERHVGRDAVCRTWEEIAQPHSSARFVIEELIVAGDRATVRWHYRWGPEPHAHVRGVDVLKVRDGKVSESLAYVKGRPAHAALILTHGLPGTTSSPYSAAVGALLEPGPALLSSSTDDEETM